MIRWGSTLALAGLLAALAGGCGGDDGDRTPRSADGVAVDTATVDERRDRDGRDRGDRARDERRERGDARARRARSRRARAEDRRERRARERAPAQTDPAPAETDSATPEDRGREALEDARRTVRAVVELIDAGDPSVCRAHFTQAYAETVSGERGEAAFERCERDIARSEDRLELTVFGPGTVRGRTAVVRFNLRVNGRLTSEGWRLRYAGDRWRVHARD